MTTTQPSFDLFDNLLVHGLLSRWVRRCYGPDDQSRRAALEKLPPEFAALVRHAHEQTEWLRLLRGKEVIDGQLYKLEQRAGEFLQASALPAVAEPNALEQFIRTKCEYVKDHRIRFGEFYARFLAALPSEERKNWSRKKVSRAIQSPFRTGTGSHNITYIFDVAWVAS